jgi:hypothetical protein
LPSDVLGLEHEAVAHRIRVGIETRLGFVKNVPSFGAGHVLAPKLVGDDAVAGRVQEKRPGNGQTRLAVQDQGIDSGHPAAITDCRYYFGIEVEIDSLLRKHRGQEHEIPDRVGPPVLENLRVVDGTFLNQEFRDDSCLAPVRMVLRTPMGCDPDLGRRISAQYGSVMKEPDTYSLTRCRNGGADTCEASSTHHEVVGELFRFPLVHRLMLYSHQRIVKVYLCRRGDSERSDWPRIPRTETQDACGRIPLPGPPGAGPALHRGYLRAIAGVPP